MTLNFCILQDNGQGISGAENTRISDNALPAGGGREGIGLKTTRARLRQLYSDAHQLKLCNSAGKRINRYSGNSSRQPNLCRSFSNAS